MDYLPLVTEIDARRVGFFYTGSENYWVYKIIENRYLFNINRIHFEIVFAKHTYSVRLPTAWNSFLSAIFVHVWKQIVKSSARLVFFAEIV